MLGASLSARAQPLSRPSNAGWLAGGRRTISGRLHRAGVGHGPAWGWGPGDGASQQPPPVPPYQASSA